MSEEAQIPDNELPPAAEEATAAIKGKKIRKKKEAVPPPASSPDESHPLHPYFKTAVTAELDRERVTVSSYNPRGIDRPAQVKLRQGLEEFGMVEPFIVNIQTGNLVAGHQRLKLFDQKMGRDHGYKLQCRLVDLSPTKEKELNVLLNNQGAQGYFDYGLMANLVGTDQEFDVELAGFDPLILKQTFEAYAPDAMLQFEGMPWAFGDPNQPDDAAADADAIRAMKASKEEYKEVAGDGSKDGFYLNIVFGTVDEKQKFCAELNINPETKNVLGRVLAQELGVDIGYEAPKDPESATDKRQAETTQVDEPPKET